MKEYRVARKRYPLDRRVVKKVREAMRRIADRSMGKLPSSREERRRDQIFDSVMQEAQPYWGLHRLIQMEKRSAAIWNGDTYKERVLDQMRQVYFQKLWRRKDTSLDTREEIFESILSRCGRVTRENPSFPLELYLATVVRFPDPMYRDFEPELEAIKKRMGTRLVAKGILDVHQLRIAVASELREEMKSFEHGRIFRYVAAMILGPLGETEAINILREAGQESGIQSWKIRRAALDIMGGIYRYLEKRLPFLQAEVELSRVR